MKLFSLFLVLAFALTACGPKTPAVPTPDAGKIVCHEGFVGENDWIVYMIYPENAPWNPAESTDGGMDTYDGSLSADQNVGIVSLPPGKLLVGVTVGAKVLFSTGDHFSLYSPKPCLNSTVWYEVETPPTENVNFVKLVYVP
jgi:hypothetical protein